MKCFQPEVKKMLTFIYYTNAINDDHDDNDNDFNDTEMTSGIVQLSLSAVLKWGFPKGPTYPNPPI